MQFTNQYKKEYSDAKKQSSTPSKNLSHITESTSPTY